MPRLGLATIDISTLAGSGGAVTGIDDFFFESFSAGQMQPIHTADRTNRLAYSEDLSQTGVYSRTNVDVASNNTTAPDGTLTAETVTATTANGIHTLSMTGTNTVAMSVFAKANGYNMFRFNTGSSANGRATFDLSDGTIHATSGTFFSKASIEDHGNGWYRCSCVIVGGSATNMTIAIEDGSNNVSFAGDGTSGIHFWGAQSEDNTETTAYIPTTSSTVTVSTTLNDTSEVWDFDGTDIMIAEDPEDEGFWEESYPEGATLPELVLNGDYEELGSELVASGTFSSFSKDFGDVTISGDTASFVNTGSNANSRVSLDSSSIVANKRYKIVFDVSRYVVGEAQIVLQGTTHTIDISAGVDTYTVYLLAGSSGDTKLRFKRSGGAGDFDFDVDNISVKQVDPNDRWTLGTNWSIEDGKAVGTSTTTNLQQLSILEVGTTYELTFTISDYSSGSVKPNIGGVDGTTRSSNGAFTEIIGPATTTHFYFDGVSAFTGKIDNVSISEYAITPQDV